MRVKARLTNDAVEQQSDPPPDYRDDLDFKALAALFPADPLVAYDAASWYLSGSAIDEADDSLQPFAALDVAEKMLRDINGIGMLLRSGTVVGPVRLSGEWEGCRANGGARHYGLRIVAHSLDNLSASSATKLLDLAGSAGLVRRVLHLLAHANREWTWIDLWRIWDVMKSYFPAGKGRGEQKAEFRKWVVSLDANTFPDKYDDFEHSANDPGLGPTRRHASRDYAARSNRWNNHRIPQRMSEDDALIFVKQVVVEWIKLEHKVVLDPQFKH